MRIKLHLNTTTKNDRDIWDKISKKCTSESRFGITINEYRVEFSPKEISIHNMRPLTSLTLDDDIAGPVIGQEISITGEVYYE